MNNTKKIGISTDYIKLESLLKFAGITVTGGDAKNLIQEGKVLLNGEPCFQRGRKIRPGDKVGFGGIEIIVTKEQENP